MVPSQMAASAPAYTTQTVTSKDLGLSNTHKTILITIGIALTYLAFSEKAQFVAAKATLRNASSINIS
jgi:hypothetical protein